MCGPQVAVKFTLSSSLREILTSSPAHQIKASRRFRSSRLAVLVQEQMFSDGQCKSRLTHVHVTISLQHGGEGYVIGPAGSNMSCSSVWKIWSRGGAKKLKFGCRWVQRFSLGVQGSDNTTYRPQQSSSHEYVINCTLMHGLTWSPCQSAPCSFVFSVRIITGFNSREMGLLQMMKEIAEFHHRAFVFWQGESWAKWKKRTCHFARHVCEGAAVLIRALCGARRESGSLSGRKGWSSVPELRPPSILIKNT